MSLFHLLGTGRFDNGCHSQHFVLLSKSLPSNYPTLAPPNPWEMGDVSVYCPYFTDRESEAPREKMIHDRPGGPTESPVSGLHWGVFGGSFRFRIVMAEFGT